MNVSELIDLLSSAQNKHGDLEVFAMLNSQEYLIESTFRAKDGPLAMNAGQSTQQDLPERVVLELADF